MRVVATAPGQYDQIYREPGEVFELLDNDDGSMPIAERWIPKLDAAGKEIEDEGHYEPILDKNGNTIHRDYAEDRGNVALKSGPLRGEVLRVGWMRQVPDSTPTGIYPEGTDFWGEGQQRVTRSDGVGFAGPAPVRGTKSRPVRDRVSS